MGALHALPLVAPVALAEAKAYLRATTADEDALVGDLLRTATATCEAFTGLALLARAVEEVLSASPQWTRLSAAPVRAITSVRGIPAEGSEFALPVAAYAIDIDGAGEGWVRVSNPGAAGRVRVSYQAGLASEPAQVPEALRHGIIRLAAHLFDRRGEEGEPPAAVAALWRPWRRMRLQ